MFILQWLPAQDTFRLKMSRWRMMIEAVLVYVGGLNIGAYFGYRLTSMIRNETGQLNPFAGTSESALALIVLILCAIVGPFALQSLMEKWRILTYPTMALCAVVMACDLYHVIRIFL